MIREVSKDKSTLCVTEKDLNKNVYRYKCQYIVTIEQDVVANSFEEAEDAFANSGIEYSEITPRITHEYPGVETQSVDADYDQSLIQYIGKVAYEDDEYAKEDGYVEINTYLPEDEEVAA